MQVDWRPFFLRPDTPPEGRPVPAYVLERQKDPNDPLKLRVAREGLMMVERKWIPSTRRAHEAAEFARGRGKLEPMHAALLRRYWTKGEDLWAMPTLRGAAQDAGLDADELEEAIEAGTYREQVERGVQEAQELGIQGVPFFILDDRFAIEGAQELPVFEKAMRQLGEAPRA